MSAPAVDQREVVTTLRAAAAEIDLLTYNRLGTSAALAILWAVAPDWHTGQAALITLLTYLDAAGSNDGWLSTWGGAVERNAAARLVRAAADATEQAVSG